MTRIKTFSFRLATLLLSLLFVFLLLEIGTRAANFLGYSRDISLAEIRRSLDTFQLQEQDLVAPRRQYQPWIGAHMLHPYLGYVRNPRNRQQVLNDRPIAYTGQ